MKLMQANAGTGMWHKEDKVCNSLIEQIGKIMPDNAGKR